MQKVLLGLGVLLLSLAFVGQVAHAAPLAEPESLDYASINGNYIPIVAHNTVSASDARVIARLTATRPLNANPRGTAQAEPNLNHNQGAIRARVRINNSDGRIQYGIWRHLYGAGGAGGHGAHVHAGDMVRSSELVAHNRSATVRGHAAGMLRGTSHWQPHVSTAGLAW